ncbi:MAG: LuxR C-terminal-related transcriptional regulator [Thermomicrobiales bacterium]
MYTQVLVTKLYIPPPLVNVVPRPGLIGRLNEGLHRKLTLISAPAGFGKTTLVSEWIAGCERPVAWLSLDEADNDPTRFLAYIVTSLRAVAPSLGEGVLDVLQSAQPPPIESLLTVLLNEITALPTAIVLVLDDYHVIDSQPIDLALTFLLDHLPPQLHLVITTREDPPLPVGRLRARGHLTELRAADLRFSPSEAAEFLNTVMGLNLSEADIAALEDRTEGWIAGLQLAALTLRGRDDVSGFIRAFTGNDRYIVDYLVEEVLQRQSQRVRSFLLHTSILDRLCGPLCDAVVLDSLASGQETLDYLERANLFLVPLDNERRWYRYHHLFAELLRHRLRQRTVSSHGEDLENANALHGRASVWYEDNGFRSDAVRHALASEDLARAADLIELAAPAMRQSRKEATFLDWLRVLPDEIVRRRPVLSVLYAGTLLSHGDLEDVEDRLQDAERWMVTTADSGDRLDASSVEMIVVDEDAFRRLPGTIAVYRAGRALALGDVDNTVLYARRALELISDDDHLYRGAAAALLGLASWTNGDLNAAHRLYEDGMASLLRAGYITDAIGGVLALADIRIAQGRLHDTMTTYQQALQLASKQVAFVMRGTADMYVGMSELERERNNLDTAAQHLKTSKDLGESTGFPQNPYRWCVAMARIRRAHGDLDGALGLLHEAERVFQSDFFPNVRPLAAQKTRVWVAQGRLLDALGWVREQGLSADDDLSYIREYEHITLARVLLARHANERDDRIIHEAIGLLERLRYAAERGDRTGSVIEILVLLGLAHQTRGNIPAALVQLERALTLAEPEGFIRLFVDEGAPMARLLTEAATRGMMPDYTRSLLAAFGDLVPAGDANPSLPPAGLAQSLLEPLSHRELEVLHLIAQGLSNNEIGERLFLALSTVKGHNRMIFDKLDVQRRTEAVARARELGLL